MCFKFKCTMSSKVKMREDLSIEISVICTVISQAENLEDIRNCFILNFIGKIDNQ